MANGERKDNCIELKQTGGNMCFTISWLIVYNRL